MFLTFAGFYIHLESSYPRSQGDSVRFESPYVVSSYRCVTFQYHMFGKHVGRLNVFVAKKDSYVNLFWRLSGDQGDYWTGGSIKVTRYYPFKVRPIVKLSLFLVESMSFAISPLSLGQTAHESR